MQINRITIHNFRILHNSVLDFKTNVCLLLGRNNTGKTSFMVLVEKFLRGGSFDFNDFSMQLRNDLLNFDESTDTNNLTIQLILDIGYTKNDDLCNLSEFFLDLDPACNEVHILFECAINKKKLLEALKARGMMDKEKLIRKYISEYLEKSVYIFEKMEDLETKNRYRLIKKEFKDIEKLIDFEIIHAKRSVSSSEEKRGTKVLSAMATAYFNQTNVNAPDQFEAINQEIEKMDDDLGSKYETFFRPFLQNAKDFLGMDELKVVSSLKAGEIVSDSSEVVYGDPQKQLPEYLNGLGHMNILYLLLNIEIKKQSFIKNNKDIKLFFIEEPEAHTHPQLQYIFAEKISALLKGVSDLQTIISTHSPHIVANHPFEHIRYMSCVTDANGTNIKIKNFYEELKVKYKSKKKEFEFIKQYLTVESSELFFADKAIFIEGISEGVLIRYFMKQYDKKAQKEEEAKIKKDSTLKPSYIPLSAQNITIVQAGANAKVFEYLIEFLEIPTIVITDIDTVHPQTSGGKTVYEACPVLDPTACNTSNGTIKHYLDAPAFDKNGTVFADWFKDMKEHKRIGITPFVSLQYQCEEDGYYPRSFEDAFINCNLKVLQEHVNSLMGLKLVDRLKSASSPDIYELTQAIIEKKSAFASSLLFVALSESVAWKTPKYIWEGLKWLQEKK